jgi:hypothetical protein
LLSDCKDLLPSISFKFTHKILQYKWIAKLAFSTTPNVPMERQNGCLASFLPTMLTYGTLLSLFDVPSERLVGRKKTLCPFRSIGTIGELGVLLVVNFMGKLKLYRRALVR